MTPRIIRNPGDMERVLNEEARKMSWYEGQVSKYHGWPHLNPNGQRCAPIWEQNPGDPSRWAPGQQVPNGPPNLSLLPPGNAFQPPVPQPLPQPPGGSPQPVVPQGAQGQPQIPPVQQPLGPIQQQQYQPQGAMQQQPQQQQPQGVQAYPQQGTLQYQPQQGTAVTQVPQNLPPQMNTLPVVTTVVDGAPRQTMPAGGQANGPNGTNPASQGRETRSWVNTPQ
jgi:hypothetical protein